MKRKLILFSLMLVLVFALVGCAEETNKSSTGPVALVNDQEVSRADFEEMLERNVAQYTQQGMDFTTPEGKEMLVELEQYVVDNLVRMMVLTQEAEKKGFVASEDEVEQELEMLRAQFADEEEFQAALVANQLDIDTLKTSIAQDIVINHLIESEVEEPAVSKEEVEALYEQYSQMSEEEMPEFELVEAQLTQEVKNNKMNQEVSQFMDDLMQNNNIEILI